MFRSVNNNVSFPQLETDILAFWKEQGIYEKSLAAREGARPFVFYEGPPTANGLPHPGHCLTRAIKDLFPRYRTMRGELCQRKAGWDTHGLPVEVEVCKELGIHSKEEIEEYGVEPFIQLCQKSVWRYMQEWERLTERLGFWVRPAGSVRHLPPKLRRKRVVEPEEPVRPRPAVRRSQDRLVVGARWYRTIVRRSRSGVSRSGRPECVRAVSACSTMTSELKPTPVCWSGRRRLGHLPSNQFAAVHPASWSTARSKLTNTKRAVERLIIADALIDVIERKTKREFKRVTTMQGDKLVGLKYRPPFDYYTSQLLDETAQLYTPKDGEQWANYPYLFANNTLGIFDDTAKEEWLGENQQRPLAWHVVPADFVTTDSGTGIVHIAPAFGEDDYEILRRERNLFGPEDRDPPLINAVGPDGKFTADAPDYEGRWVKDCDKDITRNLKERGLLFYQEQYLHEYPFCWRAEEDPLIQYPRRSWFIRTTQFKDRMLANNSQINWLPEHIKEGRFGNFLETNVDWALSRERYWGTPLPIWVCQETGRMEAIGSYAELLEKPGVSGTEVWEAAKAKDRDLVDDLRVHKPYIDEVTYDSPFADGARMQRVTEVIDCWYDSGAMPFAQWGYPHQNHDKFESEFPADFISEALDQTRGWFYSLLAISTLLWSEEASAASLPLPRGEGRGEGSGTSSPDSKHPHPNPLPEGEGIVAYPHPYKTCIVLGLMLSEWYERSKGEAAEGEPKLALSEEDARKFYGKGKYSHNVGKMSKSKRNYREPGEIFEMYGADALRWYFFANQAPWTSIRYSEQSIKESIPRYLLTLWNCYSFFVNYANSNDRFHPGERIDGDVGNLDAGDLARGEGFRPVNQRREIDRWVLSELHRTCAVVTELMDAYDNYGASQKLDAFVDNLSNWYVRRNKPRFQSTEYDSQDKVDAYWTLYECLLTMCKLTAPFTPFVAEEMWQNLTSVFEGRATESVHLCDFPTGDAESIDEALSERMDLGRLIASLGLAARNKATIKVRQPLAKLEVILADQTHQAWLESHRDVVAEELNVKQVEFTDDPDQYIDHEVVPNFKLLGPKLGKLMPKVKKWLSEQTGADLLANLRDNGKLDIDIDGQHVQLVDDDVEVRIAAKEGWTAANDRGCVVVLSTELTPELLGEGYARDIVRLVNDLRKEIGCEFTDHIELALVTGSPELKQAIEANAEYIKTETQADTISDQPIPGIEGHERQVGESTVTISLRVAQAKS